MAYDSNFSNTTFLCHFDGTTYVDKSAYARTISQSSAPLTPGAGRNGSGAMVLAGNGYMSTPSDNNLQFGSDDFTLEIWFKTTAAVTTIMGLIDIWNSNGVYLDINAAGKMWGGIQQAATGNKTLTGTTTVTPNVWHHAAMVRSGDNAYLFLDGVLENAITGVAGTIETIGEVMVIGCESGSRYFVGAIDDVRITKGLARYTTAFTPDPGAFPDSDVMSVAGYTSAVSTFLHLDGNAGSLVFTDQKGKIYSAAGTASLSQASPKVGSACLALNGSGAYINTPTSITDFAFNADDFTIEVYIKTSTVREQVILDFYTNSGTNANWQLELNSTGFLRWYRGGATPGIVAVGVTNLADGLWHHIAICRASGTLRGFVDGALVFTAADVSIYDNVGAGVMTVGAQVGVRNAAYDFSGFIDEIRIIKGLARYTTNFVPPVLAYPDLSTDVDPYFYQVSALLHFENGIIDSAPTRKVYAFQAGGSVSTARSKFGTGSALFTTNNKLYTASDPVFDFDVGDYTVEMFVYLTAYTANGTFMTSNSSTWGSGKSCIRQHTDNAITMLNFEGSYLATTGPNAIPLNQWSHLAVTRSGNTFRIFVDGAIQGSGTYTGAVSFSVNGTAFGGSSWGDASIAGNLDEIRVTKGYARYTANFGAPALPFPNSKYPNGLSAGARMSFYNQTSPMVNLSAIIPKAEKLDEQIKQTTPLAQWFASGQVAKTKLAAMTTPTSVIPMHSTTWGWQPFAQTGAIGRPQIEDPGELIRQMPTWAFDNRGYFVNNTAGSSLGRTPTYFTPGIPVGGSIQGKTKVEGTVTGGKLVRIYYRPTGAMISQTISDPITGIYKFTGLEPGSNKYYVMAFDSDKPDNVLHDAIVHDVIVPRL